MGVCQTEPSKLSKMTLGDGKWLSICAQGTWPDASKSIPNQSNLFEKKKLRRLNVA